MKVRVQTMLLCAVVLGAVFTFALTVSAQVDEEDLVTWLAQRVDELFGRVEALERIYEGPGAPDRDSGRSCLLGQVNEFGADSPLQNESMVKFVTMFNQAPSEHHLVSVRVEKESGEVLLLYNARHEEGWAYVFEHWDGCEFVGSSPWRPAKG